MLIENNTEELTTDKGDIKIADTSSPVIPATRAATHKQTVTNEMMIALIYFSFHVLDIHPRPRAGTRNRNATSASNTGS